MNTLLMSFSFLKSRSRCATRGPALAQFSFKRYTHPKQNVGYRRWTEQMPNWHTYQRRGKHMVKKYVGQSADLTTERLEATARALLRSGDGEIWLRRCASF